jgi:hypothetical protein
VGLQDTESCRDECRSPAKGMTACSEAKPLGEQLVLLVRLNVCWQQLGLQVLA